jgi:DNA-binding XRE family transcriptional regulator
MVVRTTKTRVKLGDRIQRLRKSSAYTQEELAEIVGISRTHMGHIEQGIKSPSLEVMEKIARALKVKMNDLF